jgi:glycosyltransferase involved in cell wall biosynthesis
MRILLVIDDLGSGGAQRQLVNLAKGLKKTHERVGIFIYNPTGNFFFSEVLNSNIQIHKTSYNKGFSLKTIYSLYRIIKIYNYSHIISFLDTPNLYSELASIFLPKIKLFVSERSSRLHESNFFLSLIKRFFHLKATYIIANSYSHGEWLKQYWWLKNKVKVVYNGYDFNIYKSYNSKRFLSDSVIVVGRVSNEKNGINLIRALNLFYNKRGFLPFLNWVGRIDNSRNSDSYFLKMELELDKFPNVKKIWQWLGERQDITDLLNNHKALILPSFYEGLPNAICEAFACGLPVIASNVCDNSILVSPNSRGFVFDPSNINEIEEAIWKIISIGSDDWNLMSNNAINYAHSNLDVNIMTSSFESILEM